MRANSLLFTCGLLLSLSAATEAATIQGRVVDSFTQRPPTHNFDVNDYLAVVQLEHIPSAGHSDFDPQEIDPDGDGSFVFTDLDAGTYRLLTNFRAGYTRYTGPALTLDADEVIDVGTITLHPPPVIAIAMTPCTEMDDAFKCPFSVTIQSTVGRPQQLKAWLHLYVANTGSPIGHTQTVVIEEYFRLGSRKRKTLNWALPLGRPGRPTPFGACAELYVSLKAGEIGAHYETVGYNWLFCVNSSDLKPAG